MKINNIQVFKKEMILCLRWKLWLLLFILQTTHALCRLVMFASLCISFMFQDWTLILLLWFHLSRLWSMAVACVGRACLFSIAFLRYWIPSQRSQISSNCLGRISAPLFLVKPVSSRLSSHISMSSFPESRRVRTEVYWKAFYLCVLMTS